MKAMRARLLTVWSVRRLYRGFMPLKLAMCSADD
jgi:hypothetical protein